MNDSVAGFGIGDVKSSCIAVSRGANQMGVAVKTICSLVSFDPKQRRVGAKFSKPFRNLTDTVGHVKRLLGKSHFTCYKTQREKPYLPYRVIHSSDDSIEVIVTYRGNLTSFTPEQIFAMILLDFKQVHEGEMTRLTHSVIAVPVYFTDRERQAVLNSAEMAGICCLQLLNETTAIALHHVAELSGGHYIEALGAAEVVHVVFVDIGYSALQVLAMTLPDTALLTAK